MTLIGFYERSAFYAYIPFLIVLVFGFWYFSNGNFFLKKFLILFILSIALTLCFPIINNFVLSKSLTNSSFYLLSYSLYLFFLLTFLLLIEIAETKNEVKNSILNPVCISFVLIYGGIALLTQGGYLRLGSQFSWIWALSYNLYRLFFSLQCFWTYLSQTRAEKLKFYGIILSETLGGRGSTDR